MCNKINCSCEKSHNKIEQLDDYFNKKDVKSENALYMGDDIPDYPVMKGIGLPCCPQDAVPEIKAICNYISHKNGGNGAVRDVIEQVLNVLYHLHDRLLHMDYNEHE